MVGNTGGMGGFFGVLWRIGKGFPFSEGQPYAPSTGYWLFAQAQDVCWCFFYRPPCDFLAFFSVFVATRGW